MHASKKFKHLLRRAPEPITLVVSLIFLSLVYGFIISFLTNGFSLQVSFFLYLFSLSFVVFCLPALLYGLITVHVVKFIDRHGYLLSIFNQTSLFIGLLLSLSHSTFLLFFVGIIYSVNILAICAMTERKTVVPLFYPIIYILLVFFGLSYFASFAVSWLSLLYLLILGVITLILVHFVDYIFKLNAKEVSVLSLVSAYMKNKPLTLPEGFNRNTLLQRLVFSSDEDVEIDLPGLHPGPVKSIGGGDLAQRLIELRNKDSKGYFWHVPSCHEEDPTRSDISQIIFEEEADPNFSKGLSKMLKIESGPFEVYGHRAEDFYLIFIDAEGENDFRPEIFEEIRQNYEDKIVFVDLHNHPPFEQGKILHSCEKEAKILKEAVSNLIEDLRDEPLQQLKSSTYVSKDERFMVLLEEINGEKYLFVTLNTNGISRSFLDQLKKIEEKNDFDEVLFLTTDTHHSIHFVIEEGKIDQGEIEEAVQDAKEETKDTKVGLSESFLEGVGVLGREYHAMESSANIIVHLFSALLGAIYFIFFIGCLLLF